MNAASTASPSESSRSAELAGMVSAYREATEQFIAVAAALSEADLDRRPAEPDGWTPRMVIHHVADSETNSYVRLRRLLAEPAGTTIQGYDEAQWARALHYDRPVAASLAVFRAVRESSAELLDLITPERPGPRRCPHRVRAVHARRLAGHLRRARPRPRRADPSRAGLRPPSAPASL